MRGKRQVAVFENALRLTDELNVKIHELWQYKEDELTADVITQAMSQITVTGNALCDALGPEFFVFRNNEPKAAVKRMLTAAEGIVGFAEALKLEAE